MESSIHQQLKNRFGQESGGQSEVWVDGYRIDAIDPSGILIEVQAAPLSALRRKLAFLLKEHVIRVIKPIAIGRWITRREKLKGPDLPTRRSPYRGELRDAFDDLVGIAKIFPHPNLTVELLGVHVEEIRLTHKRKRRDRVVDRRLLDVVSSTPLRVADDLWQLLPEPFETPFTTLDCAHALGRPVAFAQRVAYCLRMAGAIESVGFRQRRRVYGRRSELPNRSVA